MKATDKQINYFIMLFKGSNRKAIKALWNKIPKTNNKYTGNADYRELIFRDFLKERGKLEELNVLIKLMLKIGKYHLDSRIKIKQIVNILRGMNTDDRDKNIQ